jgi:TonB-linked SusC/RagA family outer membrane protein
MIKLTLGNSNVSKSDIRKMARMTKLSLFFLLVSMQVTANSYSQNVSLDVKNEKLGQVLKVIEHQTGYRFTYSNRVLPAGKPVTLQVREKNVNEVLNLLLQGLDLAYREEAGKLIVIFQKPAEQKIIKPQKNADTTVDVRGRVFDTKEPPAALPGVSISVKNKTIGTVTDANGNFDLRVARGDVLMFSFTGYKPVEYTVTNGRDNITISLTSATMQEVVVTGYSEQKKRHLANSIATVNITSAIEGKPITQLSQALQGGTTGLTVTQSSGLPGGDAAAIKIRGISTLGNTNPLVLVDGVPFNINDVDPTTVEKITILKDAAAASIYGSRAANGVIVISTKRGIPGKVSIVYENFAGVQKPMYLPQFVDAVKYMQMSNEAADNITGGHPFADSVIEKTRTGVDPVRYPNTDWMSEVLDPTAFTHSHTLSISGGNSVARFAVNGNYLKQDGIMRSTGANRYSLRANTSVTLKPNLLMYLDMSVIRKEQILPVQRFGNIAGSAVGYILYELYRIPPTVVSKYPVWPNGYQAYGKFGDYQNPVAELERGGYTESKTDIISINFQPQWSITPALKAKGQYMFRVNSSQSITNRDAYNFFNYYNGQLEYTYATTKGTSVGRTTYQYLSGTLDYSKTIGKHYLFLLGGLSREIDNLNNYDIATLASYFIKFNYVFNDKYLFESTWRRDGSSRFGPGNKWGDFPSMALGWNVHKENFLRSVRAISNLKLRASYGLLGNNQNIGLYQYQNLINAGNGTESTIGNPDITWETVRMLDIGADIGLFNNKLEIVADWFDKITDDILLSPPLSLSSGIGTVPLNAGKVRNRGYEIAVNYSPRITKDLRANVNVGYSYYTNEILSLRGGPYISTTTINKEGYPIGVYYGYRTDGLLQQKDIDANVPRLSNQKAGDVKYIDLTGDGMINEADKEILGNPNPQGNYFVNLRLEYKNVDFETQVNGFTKSTAVLAGRYASVPLNPSNTSGGGIPMTWQLDYWTPTNTGAYFPRLLPDQTNNLQPSNYWMKNAAFARVRFIQLGYTIQSAILKRVGVNRFRVYANAQNPFTFSSMKYLDPESRGTEETYPLMQFYTLGVSIKF